METTLIAQIAQKVFYKSANIPKELQKSKKATVVEDQVTLSKDALAKQQVQSGGSAYDSERDMKVQRIHSLVEEGNYKMDKEVIDKIAEKIADMLF